MIGKLHAVDPQLGLNAATAQGLEEALRLYVDGKKRRTLERTSLGLQNALYLALLSLEIEKQEIRRTQRKEPFLPILALEEPEAHLHPHLQRLVFDDFLERARRRKQPVIVSTHSPHLASVASIENLVLFKDHGVQGCEAKSVYSFILSLDPRARKDLARFLDITKTEMLFSKGTIFVEGDVEVLLVSQFAKIMDKPLDKYGIAICNVSGAHFEHVVTLAHRFGVPFIVLTDGDKFRPVKGLQRGIDLIQIIKPSLHSRLKSRYDAGFKKAVRRYLRWVGIFVNDWTLEVALLEAGLGEELKKVFVELGDELGVQVRAGSNHVDQYLNDRTEDNMRRVLVSMADARWGKGRFAHRLVKHIQAKAESLGTQQQKDAVVPEYIRSGIQCLIAKVESERTGI